MGTYIFLHFSGSVRIAGSDDAEYFLYSFIRIDDLLKVFLPEK